MRRQFLILLFIVTNVTYMFGQTETEHFVYEKEKDYITISLKGKERIDTFFQKLNVRLEGQGVAWILDARVRPFQELIAEGVFSKERIKELEEANDPLGIYVFFNETGIISGVYFSMPIARKSLLTDWELYSIYRKYLGAKYNLANVIAWDDNSLTPKRRSTFLSFDFFNIPFDKINY